MDHSKIIDITAKMAKYATIPESVEDAERQGHELAVLNKTEFLVLRHNIDQNIEGIINTLNSNLDSIYSAIEESGKQGLKPQPHIDGLCRAMVAVMKTEKGCFRNWSRLQECCGKFVRQYEYYFPAESSTEAQEPQPTGRVEVMIDQAFKARVMQSEEYRQAKDKGHIEDPITEDGPIIWKSSKSELARMVNELLPQKTQNDGLSLNDWTVTNGLFWWRYKEPNGRKHDEILLSEEIRKAFHK